MSGGGGESRNTKLVISHFYEGVLIDSRLVKLFFVGNLTDFRIDTRAIEEVILNITVKILLTSHVSYNLWYFR